VKTHEVLAHDIDATAESPVGGDIGVHVAPTSPVDNRTGPTDPSGRPVRTHLPPRAHDTKSTDPLWAGAAVSVQLEPPSELERTKALA